MLFNRFAVEPIHCDRDENGPIDRTCLSLFGTKFLGDHAPCPAN